MSISSSSDWPKAQNPAVAPASPFGAVHVCLLVKWEPTQKKIRLKKYKKSRIIFRHFGTCINMTRRYSLPKLHPIELPCPSLLSYKSVWAILFGPFKPRRQKFSIVPIFPSINTMELSINYKPSIASKIIKDILALSVL